MLLRLRRIAVALTAALALAAASVPTNAEARGFFVGPGWGGGWGREVVPISRTTGGDFLIGNPTVPIS